jgi:hypothetical protein
MSDFKIKEFVGMSILVTLEIMSACAEFAACKIKYGTISKVIEKIMIIAVVVAIIIMRILKIGETVGEMIDE